MKPAQIRLSGRVVALAVVLVVSVVGVQAEWNAASSTTFTYCMTQFTCPFGLICTESSVGVGEDCDELCYAGPAAEPDQGGCIGNIWTTGLIGWELRGNGYTQDGGSFGNHAHGTETIASIQAQGERTSPEIFTMSGNREVVGYAHLQLSLIRYDGPPQAFQDVRVTNVNQLVQLGLIEPGDILFVANTTDLTYSFLFEVDVTGVPDDELVMFAIGHGQAAEVPATTTWGVVALVMLIAAVGARWLAGRRAYD